MFHFQPRTLIVVILRRDFWAEESPKKLTKLL